jgi:adiponectin receptor
MSPQTRTTNGDSADTTLVNTPEMTETEEDTPKVKEMTSKAVKKVKKAVLYTFGDAPPFQQDNRYILGGYRGELNSFKGCFDSLWYWHNETGTFYYLYEELMEVNIWSHLLGAIGFGVLAGVASFDYLQRYPTSSKADIVVFACFFGGAVMCLAMSASVRFMKNRGLISSFI